MQKIFAFTVNLFLASVCYAQVLDNFSDGDLTNDPVWTPDNAANWVVLSNQLRSNSATPSSGFYITTPSTRATQTQWEFWINLQFNTSSANYVDVFLTADQANLSSPTLNGYFIRIGGTPDEISLYRMVNGVAGILINGTDGITNLSNNTLRIKVTRDTDNLWTLQRDATGGNSYVSEGTATDNTFTSSQFFGIRIQQSTASFFNRHFFDDIYVGEIIVDNTPPSILSTLVINPNHIQIVFDEPLLISSAQTTTNYSASPGLGSSTSAQLQPDQKSVLLTFAQDFENEIDYQLTINNVADVAGNVMAETLLPFTYSSPFAFKDIILTEIFADPSPPVDLPEAEFAEIYNRGTIPINLSGWKFTDGSSSAILPVHTLQPGQHLVLTGSATAALFTPFGPTLGVPNFPTINNTGEPLMLIAPGNHLIDSVNFNLTWYREEDKQDGGWTLELIDVNNPCGEETNWTASEAIIGGTPGSINSVNTDKPDVTGPKLLSVAVTSETELLITFDEKLEKSITPQSFSIMPEILISTAQLIAPSLRQAKLVLLNNLEPKQLYTLSITGIFDCAGNIIHEDHDQLSFALPEAAEDGDVLLNEILFNPRSGGVDFVEIVNASNKYINLKNWLLANFETEVITNPRVITTQDVILSPNNFIAITSDGITLKNQYPLAIESNFLIADPPSMNDDAGSIAVVSDAGLLLDHFQYNETMHTPLLKDDEGVSLERISVASPSSTSNWKSASSAAGFATPGYLNSNSRPENNTNENAVVIHPEIFSPNRPGQDFAQINYHFDQPGFTANIKIADQQGRIIKQIANNETLGYEGFFRWDGDRDDGSKARTGYYFVWFEAYLLDGTIKTFRKRVVIGL